MKKTLAVALIAGIALACGSDRAERYAKARREVVEAQKSVAQAEKKVEQREAAHEQTRRALANAREQLDKARNRLDKARSLASEFADDPMLFRAVQERLLEDDQLKDAAVAATVENGVVTLAGTAPSDSVRQRAVELARQTPGVIDVHDQIQVESPAVKKPAAAPEKSEPQPPAATTPDERLEELLPKAGAGT
jgi:hyperosmotically inducible protein